MAFTKRMSSMDTMDAAEMNMVFFSSTSTSLYSNSFAPQSTGAYAGTCIFLILLAVLLRALFAFKLRMERKWVHDAWNRRYIIVADQAPASEQMKRDPDAKTGVLTSNGVEEKVKVVHKPVVGKLPWRFSVDLPRAAIYTCIVGVGYLLMLAVMTLNIGYFMSVLAGSFIGELALGRYISVAEEHH